MLSSFDEYRKKRTGVQQIEVNQEVKLLQIAIDNGCRVVVDLEVFATYNNISLEESMKVKSLCTMGVEECIKQYFE